MSELFANCYCLRAVLLFCTRLSQFKQPAHLVSKSVLNVGSRPGRPSWALLLNSRTVRIPVAILNSSHHLSPSSLAIITRDHLGITGLAAGPLEASPLYTGAPLLPDKPPALQYQHATRRSTVHCPSSCAALLVTALRESLASTPADSLPTAVGCLPTAVGGNLWRARQLREVSHPKEGGSCLQGHHHHHHHHHHLESSPAQSV